MSTFTPVVSPEDLTIKPYATEVFVDHERGKSFTQLHYRFTCRQPERGLRLVQDILDDLTRAGLLTGMFRFQFNPAVKKEQGFMLINVRREGEVVK